MNHRIFSRVVYPAIAFATTASTLLCSTADAQSGSGYYTDPSTGIVYQQVTKSIDRPVVETKVEQRDQTIYRPQTVTETKPESRTIYSPVVEYNWEPRLHGRWNPFRRPAVAYHHVGRTRWEARNETVQRTNTRTEWVAEKRTVEIPKRIVRMQREQQVDFQPVGRVAPNAAGPPAASTAIASRLRPLNANERIQPMGRSIAGTFSAPRVAASTVGRMTSDPPRRSIGQGGMRATNLSPVAPGIRGQALPPASTGVGVAMPSPPFFR